MDSVCASISNALNIANALRKDTIIHVIMEGSPEPPKLLSFHGETLRGMAWDEKSIGEFIRKVLLKSKGMQAGEKEKLQRGFPSKRKALKRW